HWIHPEDRQMIHDAVTRAHASQSDGFYDVEYRFERPDGEQRWLKVRSQTFFSAKEPGAIRCAPWAVRRTSPIERRRRPIASACRTSSRRRRRWSRSDAWLAASLTTSTTCSASSAGTPSWHCT